MNADKRRLKRIGLSVFFGVNRRLKMPFSDFFSSLLGPGRYSRTIFGESTPFRALRVSTIKAARSTIFR